jgi:hypothetical protein
MVSGDVRINGNELSISGPSREEANIRCNMIDLSIESRLPSALQRAGQLAHRGIGAAGHDGGYIRHRNWIRKCCQDAGNRLAANTRRAQGCTDWMATKVKRIVEAEERREALKHRKLTFVLTSSLSIFKGDWFSQRRVFRADRPPSWVILYFAIGQIYFYGRIKV